MTCRHGAGDPSCSSHPDFVAARERERLDEERARLRSLTPDAKAYEIVDVRRVGTHLVMKVLYPNCARCSFEGHKVLVYLDVTEAQVLRWREIDPHFRAPVLLVGSKDAGAAAREAPSPAPRFPASKEGWDDAIAYAERKKQSVTRD